MTCRCRSGECDPECDGPMLRAEIERLTAERDEGARWRDHFSPIGYGTRLEDLLPAGTEAEWSCGHVAGAVCSECYCDLVRRANELAAEVLRLRDELATRR